MINIMVPDEYHGFDHTARVCLLDYGDALLEPFSDKAPAYVAKVLTERHVELRLGTGVKEVGSGNALLSDGTAIAIRCVIWGAGSRRPRWRPTVGLPNGPAGGSPPSPT
jgi:NADH dehydrogenase FAD-containing subunit